MLVKFEEKVYIDGVFKETSIVREYQLVPTDMLTENHLLYLSFDECGGTLVFEENEGKETHMIRTFGGIALTLMYYNHNQYRNSICSIRLIKQEIEFYKKITRRAISEKWVLPKLKYIAGENHLTGDYWEYEGEKIKFIPSRRIY